MNVFIGLGNLMTELTTVCLLLSNGSNNRHRGRQVLFAFEYKNY